MNQVLRYKAELLLQRLSDAARVLNPWNTHNFATWWLRKAGKRDAIGRSALTHAVHRPAGRRRGCRSVGL